MKKNWQKLLAGALAVVTAVGMTGCGSSGTETTESSSAESVAESSEEASAESSAAGSEEASSQEVDMTPMSITVSVPSGTDHNAEEDENYDKIVAYINEYTQMDVTWEFTDDTLYYDDDHLGLKISTADVADVLVVGKTTTFEKAAEEGLFWDLTDYIDDYDNLSTIPEATRANASTNGRMYGLPRSRTLARNGFGYRLDWLNNLGLAEPTTWDEFADMLYAFTYSDPDGNGVDDTVGLGLDSWGDVWKIMEVWFGVPNTWGIDENGDLIHYTQTEEYKTALAAFRELYSQGVINNGSNGIPDFTEVAAGKARSELICTGLAGAGVQVLDDQRKVETYFEDQGMATGDDPIYTLGGYLDTGKGAFVYPTTGMNNMIAISTINIKTEDQLRRVLQFLNDLCDGEMMNAIDYGFEGLTYELDEDGYISLYDSDKLEELGVSSTFRNGLNQIVPYFTADENARPVTKAPASTVVTKLETQLYEEDLQYAVTNYGSGYSSATYLEKGSAIDAILFGDGTDENPGAQLQYIKGEIDETALNEAIQQWMAAGGEQVTAEMNEAYHAAGN